MLNNTNIFKNDKINNMFVRRSLVYTIIISMLFVNGCMSLIMPRFGPIHVYLNKKVKQSKYKRIAVVPFDVSGYYGGTIDKVSGTALADRYTAVLMGIGYDVIERQRLEIIVKEQNLSMTGLIDIKTSQKVGKIIGVQGFVFGSVSGKPNAFSVMSKLVDVETGSVVWTLVLDNNIERNGAKELKKTLDKHYADGGK
jgi:PBP1b-binding outer membrane lipoprotein LpoB